MSSSKGHSPVISGSTVPPVKEKDQGGTSRFPRLTFVKLFFLLVFAGLSLRLAQIQIIDSPKYKQIAQRQYETMVNLPATRGNIYDRNGNVLVSNTMFVSLAADPKVVGKNTDVVAGHFSHTFGKSRGHYLERLQSEKRFVWLERQVRPEVAKRLHGQNFPGVIEMNEAKRLYHYDELAAQLIGFAGLDNAGLSGVELQFDKHLQGTNGYVVLQRDGLGRARPAVDYLRVEPVNGHNLYLTIDLVYQSIVEDKLKKGIERNKADGGLVIMMNPKTGELLATAQYPAIDPNDPSAGPPQSQKLRAVTDMFEPGSTFKIVTAAAALEENLVQPTQKFYAERGEYRVPLPGGKIRVIKDTHEHELLTFSEAMEYSSNIVMAKVSDHVGAERLYKMARDFGFGIETGIEYPGELKGQLKRPVQWSGTTLNTMAYGYEVGVTPLQIVAAYAAVANNGLLMKPTVVKEVVTESGTRVFEQKPHPIRQVISPKTAAILTEFFEGVVQRGTATSTHLEGVRIAGKTGTARKFIEGRYQTGSYTTSFVGFFPVEDPEIVCLVMLDNPRIGGYAGGTTAAPIFREIAQHVITTGKAIVPKSDHIVLANVAHDEITVPDVSHLQFEVARKLLEGRGLLAEAYGEGIVVRQIPSAGTITERGTPVKLVLGREKPAAASGEIVVPDLRGLSVRRAVSRLRMDKLEPKIQGSGVVIDQIPAGGEHVQTGSQITLICEPRSLAVHNN